MTFACLAVSVLVVAVLTPVSPAQLDNTNLSELLSFDGEPSIAVNPAAPDNVIAGWMRLRYDGRIWIATRASFDGGHSWSPIVYLPHQVSDYSAADVSIAFHRTGRAYLTFVDFRMTPDQKGGVYLTTSDDGGRSWTPAVEVIDMSVSPDQPIDRPWIAVDNTGGPNDGTVYVTSMSAYWHDGQHHVYLRSTDDGGNTWSPIRQVDDSAFPVGLATISYGALSVDGAGRVYVAYLSYDPSLSPLPRYFVATSVDKGATFRRSVATNVFLGEAGVYVQGWSLAADPSRGDHAVLCWIDTRLGDLDVFHSRTTDGGQTWSHPLRVNDDPVGNGVVQDEVWVAYSPGGGLGIVWRDRRLSELVDEVPFDVYAALSECGWDSLGPNTRLSTTSSPYSPVGCCNSFLGVSLENRIVHAVWGDFRNKDWDIYYCQAPLGSLVYPTPARRKHKLR